MSVYFSKTKTLRHFYRHSLLAFFGAAQILSDSFISERLGSQMYCRPVTSVFFQFSYVGPNVLSLLQADIFLVTTVIVLSIHLFRDSCSFHRAMQHSTEGCMMFSVKDIN